MNPQAGGSPRTDADLFATAVHPKPEAMGRLSSEMRDSVPDVGFPIRETRRLEVS